MLSFPYEAPAFLDDGSDGEPAYLGDLAICMPVVHSEAATQHKSPATHTAHLVVHGILHLLGYDHQGDTEAARMEQIEIDVLRQFGFENPYGAD